jgi:hypothetical protein
MFNNISYNVVVERFKVFAEGHFLIKRFTHGQIDQTDLDKDQQFPWMHLAPVEVRAAAGARVFTFDVVFADIPRDKEDKTDYQKESISDCIRLAEDLISEIQNGLTVFGDLVEVDGESSITPFIEEWTHTLSGCTLAISLSVPNNYDACDIPADWSFGGSGSGTPPTPITSLVLRVNNVDNVVQNVLDLIDGDDVTIEDLGDGRVRVNSTGGGGGGTLVSTAYNANHTTATGNQYAVGDRVWYNGNVYACIAANDAILPTNATYWSLLGAGFRLRQSPVDYNATTGDFQILNKPTIPTATSQLTNDSGFIVIGDVPPQVNSDWNAVSGVEEILNKPTLATVATSGQYTDLLSLPTIPTQLDDLTDVFINAGTLANGQSLIYDSGSGYFKNDDLPGGGTVTSVGLTMPAAFTVVGSPVTTSGTLAVTGAGNGAQYVDGTGALQTFPSVGSGTVTSVGLTSSTSGVTVASSPVTTSGNITLAIATATTSQNGLLSSTDWTTFNSKQASIGLTTVGTNLATLPNPSAVRYLRINADNTATALTIEQLRSDIGVTNGGYAVLSSDFTTVGVAFQNVTGLSFAVTAGKTYKWRATILMQATAVTNGTLSTNGPAGTSTYRFTGGLGVSTNNVNNGNANNQTNSQAVSLSLRIASADGIYSATASGTVSISVVSTVAAAITIKTGSIIEYDELI